MPTYVDTYGGRRMRHRRWELGMTQAALADKVGIRVQQIQKYEMGTNHVSASRMWEIGKVLEVPVAYFFDALAGTAQRPRRATEDLLAKRDSVEVIRAYRAMPETHRPKLLRLLQVLADGSAESRNELVSADVVEFRRPIAV